MRLFLDTSVLLAACASASGASREIFRVARMNGWVLVSTPYVVDVVLHSKPDKCVRQSRTLCWSGAMEEKDGALVLVWRGEERPLNCW